MDDQIPPTGLVAPNIFLSLVRAMSPRTPRSPLLNQSSPLVASLTRSIRSLPANAELQNAIFNSAGSDAPDELGPDEPQLFSGTVSDTQLLASEAAHSGASEEAVSTPISTTSEVSVPSTDVFSSAQSNMNSKINIYDISFSSSSSHSDSVTDDTITDTQLVNMANEIDPPADTLPLPTPIEEPPAPTVTAVQEDPPTSPAQASGPCAAPTAAAVEEVPPASPSQASGICDPLIRCQQCLKDVHYECSELPDYTLYSLLTYNAFVCKTCTEMPASLFRLHPEPQPQILQVMKR